MITLTITTNPRRRQMWGELSSDSDRTRTRTTTPVGGRECLVKVDVHRINAHIAWACTTQKRVKIGAITVNKAAMAMHDLGYLCDVGLKEPQGVGVCHHDPGDIFIHRRFNRSRI